jgi:hypothetical protein
MRSDGCLHFSTLKTIARSPAHYRYAADHETEGTPAMNLGSAVHCMALEEGCRVVRFDGTRRGAEWKTFEAAHPDDTILTASEWATAQGMADSILACPRAVELLTGAHEIPLAWEVGDRKCRGRVDVLHVVEPSAGGMAIVELKTTSDANPPYFQRTAERLGYFAQIAWYMNGYDRDPEYREAITASHGYVVAVESKPPYVVQTFELSAHALDIGMRTWRLWFERLLVCEASGQWPGYQETDALLDLPDDFGLELQIGDELVEVA